MGSCKELREAKEVCWFKKGLFAADLATLGSLASVLPALESLTIWEFSGSCAQGSHLGWHPCQCRGEGSCARGTGKVESRPSASPRPPPMPPPLIHLLAAGFEGNLYYTIHAFYPAV